jgi:hypothetical protein
LLSDFLCEGIADLSGAIGATPGHAHEYPSLGLILLSENLITIPFQFPHG